MKKFLLLNFALLLSIWTLGQSLANYGYSTITTGSLTDMTTGTTELALAGTTGVYHDDDASVVTTMGFTFYYMGTAYDRFSVNSNGQMKLGNATDNAAITGTNYSGPLASTALLCPFTGDNCMQSTGKVHYKVTGGASNHILIVEWIFRIPYASTPATGTNSTMQARLYESTGVIEYVYGTMYNNNASATTKSVALSSNSTSTTSGYVATITATPTWTLSSTWTTTSFAASSALTNLNSASDGSRRVFTFTPQSPSPAAPISMTFSSVTGSGMTVNWVDNSITETYFILTRATDAGFTQNVVTTNVASTTVAGTGSGYSSGAITGLAFATTYYFKVAAYNEASPPSSDLTGSQATNAGILSGDKTVGGSGSPNYATLTAAFLDINTNGLAGSINLILQSGYVSTSETFPLATPTSAAVGSYTVTIYPSVTGLSITSANTTGTLNLNGSKNIVFDGRVGAIGTTKDLTIENTNAGTTYAIQFINDAISNTIKYCKVKSKNTSSTGGSIVFSTTTGSNGNDNNTIDYCDIDGNAASSASPTTVSVNGIYSSGTSTTTANYNSGNTISNCNIYNFFGAGSSPAGIYLSTANSDWTITGNRIYQSSTRTFTSTGLTYYGIYISYSSGNNFTVSGNVFGFGASDGTGTTTITGSSNMIRAISLSVGTTNASSIQNNTIAGISQSTSRASTGTSSGAFIGIYVAGGLVNIGTVTGNTIGSLTGTGSITIAATSTTSSTTPSMGILNYGSTGINISNNNIGSVSITTGGSGTYVGFTGIRVSNSSGNINTITNNIIGGSTSASISVAPTNAQLIGIHSTVGVNTITGNIIKNFVHSGGNTGTGSTSSVIGIYQASTDPGQTLSQNSIYSLSNSHATAAVGVVGIFFAGPTTGTNLVARNIIHALSVISTSLVSDVRGLCFGSGLANIQNNVVRLGLDETGASLTNGFTMTGIYEVGSTANSGIYFNSVYIGGTGVNTQVSNTYAFRSDQTTNTRTFEDNIYFNGRSNATTGGKHYAVRVAGTAANPAGLTLNYNDYYVSGTGGVFGYFNSADVASIAAWRTAVGQDAGSVSGDPLFVAPTAATPNLNLSTGTPCEGIGLAIAAVTDDYTGALRSGLTPTDLGAYAGNFAPAGIDMGATALVTPLSTGCYIAAEVVKVTIKNYSASTIDFSVNNVTVTVTTTGGYSSSTVLNTGTLATGGTQNVTMPATIDMSVNGSYTFNASTSVTGDITPGNDGMSPVTRTALTLSGTYTVGSGGAYATLTAAVAAYNTASCITGPIIFNLIDATFPSETFPININANAAAGANTLTIKPATGVTTTISGAFASGALIKLNGADYVIIDGSNSGGTDRSLTITNTSTTSPTALSLASLGIGAGATNNTIKNCNISTGVSAATGYGIAIGSTPGTSGADNDYNTVQNNSITVATIPIYANGTAAVSAGGIDNLTVTGNMVNTNTTIANIGIQLGNGVNCSITKNTISVTTSASNQPVGISLETGFVSSIINANNITSVVTTATGGYGGRGITVGTGTATSALTISNNFISGVNGSNWSDFTTSSSLGIGIGMIGGSSTLTTTAGGINLYYNTVNMYGNYSYSTACHTAALYVGSAATSLDIRDNILVNSMNNTNASGTASKNYAVYSVAANTAYSDINYNDYYVSGTQGVLGYLGSDQSTLALWQTATGKDANSKNIAPVFTSAIDLHLPPSSNLTLDNLGTPITGITTDIDNETRNVTTPDMGADEFTPAALDMGATILVAPATTGCYTSTETVTVTIKNYGISAIDYSTNPVTVSVTATGGYSSNIILSSGTLTAGGTQDVSMPATIDLSANGSYTFNASTSVSGDANTGNDAMTPVTRISSTLAGSYTVGSGGNYTTLTAAVAAYNAASCITSPIIFNLTDATYSAGETFPITINANAAAGTNTLTIKPASGVAAAITGSSAVAIIKLNGADYIIIDGVNGGGSSLSLENTNTGTSSAVIWNATKLPTDGATNNTIMNCSLKGNASTTTLGCLISSGSAIGAVAEAQNNNNTYKNNIIKKSFYGIAVVGPTGNETGVLITENTIGSATTADKIGLIGIGLYQQSGVVSKNIISGVTTSTSYTSSGILVSGSTSSITIKENKISDVKNTESTGYGSNGIQLTSSSTTANVNVINNFINDVASIGYALSSEEDNGYGIVATSGGGYNIYYNSINLNTNQSATTGLPAAINITSGITTASSVDLRDNIFANTQTVGTNRYAIYSGAAATVFSNIDNNDYYFTGANLGYLGSNQVNLGAWQTATGKDANSISGDPQFVSATNQHINAAVATPVSCAGVAIGIVTTDFDGDTRLDPPDIGADEFDGFGAANWTGAVSTNWKTAGNWTFNLIPNASVDATINSGPARWPLVNEDPATPAKCRNLTINAGSVTIAAGKALTVSGALNNNVGSTGLVIQSTSGGTGSLIDNGTITGTATVERYLSVDTWHYISSPISNALSGMFLNDYLKTSDPTNGGPDPLPGWGPWIYGVNEPLEVMRGYAVWRPTSNPLGLETFTGTLNTGTETFTGNRTATDPFAGWHLAGNPYPSSINLLSGITWDQFEPNAWFWDQSANNYVAYPTQGGYGTHSRYVPPSQGFFVHIVDTYSGSTTLSISNASRIHNGVAFLKDAPAVTNGLMITASSSVNSYSDKITVHFNPDATASYDPGYDAYKLQGLAEAPQLYTKIGDTNVTCNSLPFATKTMVIPMGFTCGVNGQYTLRADSLNTFANNITISLEDLKLSTTQDLRLYPSYTFTHDNADNANRFVLHFYNPSFGIGEQTIDKAVQIYSFEDHLYIKSLDGNLLKGKVTVYDLLGKEIFHHPLSNSVLNRFTPGVKAGYYFVRVVTGDGTYNGKVFLR
jgi:trimeric autotransporter adhesin